MNSCCVCSQEFLQIDVLQCPPPPGLACGALGVDLWESSWVCLSEPYGPQGYLVGGGGFNVQQYESVM